MKLNNGLLGREEKLKENADLQRKTFSSAFLFNYVSVKRLMQS